jgi:hypothetical protein
MTTADRHTGGFAPSFGRLRLIVRRSAGFAASFFVLGSTGFAQSFFVRRSAGFASSFFVLGSTGSA